MGVTSAVPYRVFQILRTFVIVLVGYVFDVAPTFGQAMRTFVQFFTDQHFAGFWQRLFALGLNWAEYVVVLAGALLIFVVSVIQEKNSKTQIRYMLDAKPFMTRWLAFFIGMLVLIIFGVYGSGYDAADFVYMQF